MSNGNGHHWSKFCWRDWLSDPALRDCSLSAKGFWIGILSLMHEGEPIGHLTIGGKPATSRQMASNVNCTVSQADRALAELEAAGVFSRTPEGTIYSRRMVRDAKAAEAAQAWGKAGGNPNLKTRANGAEPEPPKPKGVNPPVNPPVNPQGYRPPNPPALTPPLRHGLTGGLTLELEVQTELEAEERKEVLKTPLLSPVLARVAAACETPPEGTYGSEPTPTALQLATKTVVEKLGRKLESSGKIPSGKRPKLTAVEQISEVLYGEILDADYRQEPLHRGPVDPQRTVAEQLAAIGFPHLAAAHAP